VSDFNTEHNRVVWLDIPVVDLDRAVAKVAELGGEVTQAVHGHSDT